MTTSRLSFPEIAESQSTKYITHNDALQYIDMLLHLEVEDKDLQTSPGSPADGATYIIASTGGAWSTFAADDLAQWVSGAGWIKVTPRDGFRAYVKDENKNYQFRTSWQIEGQAAEAVYCSTSTFTASANAQYVGVDMSAITSATITLASGIEGYRKIIKDEKRLANTKNITVSAAPGQAMDGISTRVINTSGGVLDMVFFGGGWRITSNQ